MPTRNGASPPAGVPCVQLHTAKHRLIVVQSERPAVCAGLPPAPDTCGESDAQTMHYLSRLERETALKIDIAETANLSCLLRPVTGYLTKPAIDRKGRSDFGFGKNSLFPHGKYP
jgi:hypothetical protein